MADPYGINPLVDEARETRGHLFDLASRERPAPTLFASGDLPPFTASGLDPQVLLRFPYTARHAAASESDPATVLGMLEQYASDPDTMFEHQGLDNCRERVNQWLAGTGLSEAEQAVPGDDFYDAIFPDEQVRRTEAQKQAEIEDILKQSDAEARRRIADVRTGGAT